MIYDQTTKQYLLEQNLLNNVLKKFWVGLSLRVGTGPEPDFQKSSHLSHFKLQTPRGSVTPAGLGKSELSAAKVSQIELLGSSATNGLLKNWFFENSHLIFNLKLAVFLLNVAWFFCSQPGRARAESQIQARFQLCWASVIRKHRNQQSC